MAEQVAYPQGRRGISLFKIAGIQINLDVSWFIIFILVMWSLLNTSTSIFNVSMADTRSSFVCSVNAAAASSSFWNRQNCC